MFPAYFHCQPSRLEKYWLLLLHGLFATYFVSLPYILSAKLAFCFACLLLLLLEWRGLPHKLLTLAMLESGQWLVGGEKVELNLRFRGAWLIVLDVPATPVKRKKRLRIWRDSLPAKEWQLLQSCVCY